MDCSLPGSSVSGILQARILEWVAISFSGGSSRPINWTRVSCIADTLPTELWGKRRTVYALNSLSGRSPTPGLPGTGTAQVPRLLRHAPPPSPPLSPAQGSPRPFPLAPSHRILFQLRTRQRAVSSPWRRDVYCSTLPTPSRPGAGLAFYVNLSGAQRERATDG